MKTIVKKFEDNVELHLIPDDNFEFLLTNQEAALGFGTKTDVIRQHKSANKNEFVENKHFVIGKNISREKISQLNITANNINKTIFWTKRGLVRLGFFIKSARARKFRDWCEDIILNTIETKEQVIQEIPLEEDMLSFYQTYGILNPNAEFYLDHFKIRAIAFADSIYGFLISTPELARLMGVKQATLRVLKKYHDDKLQEGKHYVKIGHFTWWTRAGAGWIGLHNRDGSFGKRLLAGDFDTGLKISSQILDYESLALLERIEELSGNTEQ